jgi:hypothetical protein
MMNENSNANDTALLEREFYSQSLEHSANWAKSSRSILAFWLPLGCSSEIARLRVRERFPSPSGRGARGESIARERKIEIICLAR